MDFYPFFRKKINHKSLGNVIVEYLILDLAGQPFFPIVRCNCYEYVKGILFCFDLTRPETLRSISNWTNEALRCIEHLVPIVLVGCKSDLIDKAHTYVSRDEIEHIRKWLEKLLELPVPYVETSAKLNRNIDKVFEKLARLVIDLQLSKKEMS